MLYPLTYTTSQTRRIMDHWSYELQIEAIRGTDRWYIYRIGKAMLIFTRTAPNEWKCLTSEGVEKWRDYIEHAPVKLDTNAKLVTHVNLRKEIEER